MKLLSRAEELVLLSIWNLRENAYLVSIREHLTSVTGKEWSIGAVYVPLDRLTKNGYAESLMGEPTPERGGKRKTYYRLTKQGLFALAEMKRVNDELYAGLTNIGLDKGYTG